MITSKIFNSTNIIILGMGLTGDSLAKALLKSGANVFFWDDNKLIRKKYIKTKYQIYNKYKFNWKIIDYLVPSPGISTNGRKANKLVKLARQNKCKVVSELDLFQNYLNNSEYKDQVKAIAITGTNGKSTVASLLYHVLKKNKIPSSLVGNIGNSIFSSQKLKRGFYIIEVSSYQLESSKTFSPDVACILNLSNDHLERHGNLNNYAAKKIKIFQNLTKNQFGIIGINHPILKKEKNRLVRIFNKNIISVDFNKKRLSYFSKNKKKLINKNIKKYKINNTQLQGEHNAHNILFIINILKLFNIKLFNILDALKSFQGLEHRQEVVFSNKKLLIINDSKSTNFESVIPALKNYNNIYLICGGIPKTKNIKVLNPYKKQLVKVYIIGLNKKLFFNYFKKDSETFYVRNLSKAVRMIFLDCRKDKSFKTVVFSPGASSFDQFKSFEDRGDSFKRLVSSELKNV